MSNGVNKKIPTGAGIAIVIAVFLVAALAVWQAKKNTDKYILEMTSQSQGKTDTSGQKFINQETGGEERGCLKSGGTVISGSCCMMTGDFPNTCAIGACGCAPRSSHEVKTCDCGEGKCFNGRECVGEDAGPEPE